MSNEAKFFNRPPTRINPFASINGHKRNNLLEADILLKLVKSRIFHEKYFLCTNFTTISRHVDVECCVTLIIDAVLPALTEIGTGPDTIQLSLVF